jgi:hypothetical protein
LTHPPAVHPLGKEALQIDRSNNSTSGRLSRAKVSARDPLEVTVLLRVGWPHVDAELGREERKRQEEDGRSGSGGRFLLLDDLHELVGAPEEAKLLVRIEAGGAARDNQADDARQDEAERNDKDLAEDLIALPPRVAAEVCSTNSTASVARILVDEGEEGAPLW